MKRAIYQGFLSSVSLTLLLNTFPQAVGAFGQKRTNSDPFVYDYPHGIRPIVPHPTSRDYFLPAFAVDLYGRPFALAASKSKTDIKEEIEDAPPAKQGHYYEFEPLLPNRPSSMFQTDGETCLGLLSQTCVPHEFTHHR